MIVAVSFCAGAAEAGCPRGDGAAVGIERAKHRGRLCWDDGEGLRGEGFVELDDSHVVEREAGELQCFGDGLNGTDAELFRENAGGGHTRTKGARGA